MSLSDNSECFVDGKKAKSEIYKLTCDFVRLNSWVSEGQMRQNNFEKLRELARTESFRKRKSTSRDSHLQ